MYKLLIEWLRIKLNLEPVNPDSDVVRELKLENARLHDEVNRLLDHILNPPVNEEKKVDTNNLRPITMPRGSNWQSHRRMMEIRDKEKEVNRVKTQEALKAAAKPDASSAEEKREEATNTTAVLGVNKSIEELENELSVELPTDRAGVN